MQGVERDDNARQMQFFFDEVKKYLGNHTRICQDRLNNMEGNQTLKTEFEVHERLIAELRSDLDKHARTLDEFRRQVEDPEYVEKLQARLDKKKAAVDAVRKLELEVEEANRRLREAVDAAKAV